LTAKIRRYEDPKLPVASAAAGLPAGQREAAKRVAADACLCPAGALGASRG